jgi:hypothetical protein
MYKIKINSKSKTKISDVIERTGTETMKRNNKMLIVNSGDINEENRDDNFSDNDDFEIIMEDIHWYIPHKFDSNDKEEKYVKHFTNKKREDEFNNNIIIPHDQKDQKSIILFLPLSNKNDYSKILLEGPMCGHDIVDKIYKFYQDENVRKNIDDEFWTNQLFFDRIESISHLEWILYTFKI